MARGKKPYIIFLVVTLILAAALLFLTDTVSEEEAKVRSYYPEARKVRLIRDLSEEGFIALNMPAVRRGYEVDGDIKAIVSSCVGYNGPVEILAAFDKDKLISIEIIEHSESPDYAEHIEKEWFLERFHMLGVDRYLNLAALDKESPEDIVQVTGATVSSKAVVNAVNAAIGAYQYLNNKIEMSAVADVVPQEMWQKDVNSFAINWDGGSIRIDTDEIRSYEQVERDVVLINTTGTQTEMRVKGPTLRAILLSEDIDLSSFAGIGITGRDGYYTLVDNEKLELNDVILAWEVDGKPVKDEEKPVRVAIPNELGPYWVKMVSNIDLYEEITPKNIVRVHMFDALTRGIEPYYYEYYGSKDKSIEVGKILAKFDELDKKGFFTMAANDGLEKNETISLVIQRYFIKVEGENAPMNIAPGFKLGMNVKHMTHFSTTRDAVIFPEKMIDVVRTKITGDIEGMLLEDVLLTAGMRWEEGASFLAVSTDGTSYALDYETMLKCSIIDDGDYVSLHDGEKILTNDLLRIDMK